jgi:hypothetical protein
MLSKIFETKDYFVSDGKKKERVVGFQMDHFIKQKITELKERGDFIYSK